MSNTEAIMECQQPGCSAEATTHVVEADGLHSFQCDFVNLSLFPKGTQAHPLTEACTSAGAVFSHDDNACEVNKVSVFGQEP